MEVELKLRLHAPKALRPPLTLPPLNPNPRKHLLRRLQLRALFYNVISHCILSLKAQLVISNGVSRVLELEELFDPVLGRACVAEPWRLLVVSSSMLLKCVREEFGVGEQGFVYEWKGLKLELDESNFDFGTCYELECESLNPEKDKKILERFLEENGIRYKYYEVSKFRVFKSGKLPE